MAWRGEKEPTEEESGTRGNGDGPGGKLEAVSGRTVAGKVGGGGQNGGDGGASVLADQGRRR